MFKTFKTEIENQVNKKIKRLRSDRGTEYESNSILDFLCDILYIRELHPIHLK